MDTRSRGEQPPDAEAAGEAASRHERGGVGKPPGGRRRSRSGLHRGENLFGWLFVSPSLTLLLLFLVASDNPGPVHKLYELVRPDQPHQQRRKVGRAGKLPDHPHQARALPVGLRGGGPEQLLFRDLYRPFADHLRLMAGRPGQQQVPPGQGVFQDRLLFPIDHQLDRHHHDLHLFVPGDRRGQYDPGLVRHHGAELALQPAGHFLVVPQYFRCERPACDGRSTWSWGYRSGTGFRGRPSGCASS